MNDIKYTNLPVGAHFLAVADSLIEAHDCEALNALHNALATFTLSNITGKDISLIEINEYIEEACELLDAGKTPADARASSIRVMLDSV